MMETVLAGLVLAGAVALTYFCCLRHMPRESRRGGRGCATGSEVDQAIIRLRQEVAVLGKESKKR